MNRKIKSAAGLTKILAGLRAGRKKIVFTNGCFDIIHPGHVVYLAAAKKLGDILVVGLNSDSSVKKIKGSGRPINDERSRAIVLSALEPIDYICIFSESTPYNLIGRLRPDVLVKGGDWKASCIVGSDIVKSYGGRVRTIPFVKGFSTTSVIEKLSR